MDSPDYIGQMPDDFVGPYYMPDEQKPDALLAEFVALEEERLKIEKRVEDIKERTKAIEAVLLDEWANRGVQSIKLKNRTVFIRNDFYCSKKGGVETLKVCRVLRQLGYLDMVHLAYAPASLKALVREMVDNERTVPAVLDELLQFDTIPSLRTCAS